MRHTYLEIASTPAVKAFQTQRGSRAAYARMETGAPTNDRLGADAAAFIAGRDSFYLATVSATGWPYVQHRGGHPGFLQALDDRTLAWAEFRGNRQYITAGNLAEEDRVSLFLMDYAHRERLKVFGRARVVEVARQPELAERLVAAAGKSAEHLMIVTVEAFDWNCPQHITPRYTAAEIEAGALAERR